MIRSRFSLLGVLLAAVGLMALFASSAQAESTSKWLILKAGGGLESLAEMEAEEFKGALEGSTASLLATILSIPLELLCTTGELLSAHPGPEGSVKKGASVKFTGCVALNATTKAKIANCNPKSAGQLVGTIETKTGHALLRLHVLADTTKHDTLLILPDNETTKEFTNVEMGEGCAVGENVPIIGELSVWSCAAEPNKEWLEHRTSHLITEFKPLTNLTAAGKPATLDGSANASLVKGLSFSSDL